MSISTQVFQSVTDLYNKYTKNTEQNTEVGSDEANDEANDEVNDEVVGDKVIHNQTKNYCYVSGIVGNEIIENSVGTNSPSPVSSPLPTSLKICNGLVIINGMNDDLKYDIVMFNKKMLTISLATNIKHKVNEINADIVRFDKTNLRANNEVNNEVNNKVTTNVQKHKHNDKNVTNKVEEVVEEVEELEEVVVIEKKIKTNFIHTLFKRMIKIVLTTDTFSIFEIDKKTINDISGKSTGNKNIIVLIIRKQLFYVLVGFNIGLAVGLINSYFMP